MFEDIIHFPVPESPHSPVCVLIAGISYCDGSYRIARTDCNHYVFEYIVKGRGYLRGEGREFAPQAGDVYIVPEGSTHEYGSSADDPWEKLWFNITGPLLRDLVRGYRLENVWHVPNCPVESLFREGLETLRRDPEKGHEAAALIIHRIIQAVAGTVSRRAEVRRDPLALRIKRYLDANITTPDVSLDDISRCVNKSPSQTMRIFRREWGTTPYQYLLERRLDLAGLYLCNTAKSIKEIAAELHFADEYYFANIFRRKKGISPGRYRKGESID